jgi:FdhD protein
MADDESIARRPILRIEADTRSADTDAVVVEEPLEIRVKGRGIAVTMRTPGHDLELAAGFLYSEGVIRSRADVLAINHCQQGDIENRGNIVNAYLSPKVELDLDRLTRHVFASSSCGLCGKATIAAVQQCFPPLANARRFPADILTRLPAVLRTEQTIFAQTGGLHAAALFDGEGRLLDLREDVGRHNAVDKLIGRGFLDDTLPFNQHILLVSGRASFEIMQKSLAAGIPLVAAISAPSQLAVDFADRNGQTLVGFLRDQRMNVYAGAVT